MCQLRSNSGVQGLLNFRGVFPGEVFSVAPSIHFHLLRWTHCFFYFSPQNSECVCMCVCLSMAPYHNFSSLPIYLSPPSLPLLFPPGRLLPANRIKNLHCVYMCVCVCGCVCVVEKRWGRKGCCSHCLSHLMAVCCNTA